MGLVAWGSRELLEREDDVCSGLECEHCYHCTSHRLTPAPFDIERREKSFVAKLSKPCVPHPQVSPPYSSCLGTIMRWFLIGVFAPFNDHLTVCALAASDPCPIGPFA
jgi:arginyl-tRNA--protein-N-Asp/Glu arginylyltransferase